MDIKQFTLDWGGKTLSIEIGRLAHQADAACTVQLGDTVVLSTVVMSKDVRPGMGFFPLMVDFEEKYAAAGKIKGSRFIKKEGRPSDEAVLTSRMIDRTIRPLFPPRLLNEVQVICNVLSFDGENDADIPAMVGTCIALHMSHIPWNGPVSGVRMGLLDGNWIANPTYDERDQATADLVICGTPDKLIMMEAGVNIVADETVVEGVAAGLDLLASVIALMEDIRTAVGSEKVDPTTDTAETRALREQIAALAKPFIATQVETRMFSAPLASKNERADAKSEIQTALSAHLSENDIAEEHHHYGTGLVYDEVQRYVSTQILEKDRRVDGRGIEEVREIRADVSFLPRTHGSAIFSRGETQILSTATLAGPSFEQIIDTMEMDVKKRYMHHYAFPPFSVGETKPLRGPGRREIGHGALAEKALEPVLPSKEDFPYVMRVVSETMGSNGSSSMGSTCGSTLALMDAGVPIKAPVAGVAIGLASNDDMSAWKVITDLQDLEDGPGGMDFKITGTRDGITAVQLDTKTAGLPMEIVKEAFRQAKTGRVRILDTMEAAIAQPRAELSRYAPRIESLMIHPDKIREVIGPGGKIINQIIDATGVDINIEDDGLVTITSVNAEGIKEAIQWIQNIVAEAEIGKTYKGKVTRLMDFGAFAEFLPGKEGLVHISEMAPFRIGKVGDAVKEGDEVFVKVIEIDSMGRVNLSMKQAEGNEELFARTPKSTTPPNGNGPDRGGRPQGGRPRPPRPPHKRHG